MDIDKITYKISDKYYHKTLIKKSQIIIGKSIRKDSNHIIRLNNKKIYKTVNWNTYTISRNGQIYQHYDDENYSNFIGIRSVDNRSISIVLENMGALFKSSNGDYINWINEICDGDLVEKRDWLSYKFWEKFDKRQIDSTVKLCQFLCKKHTINSECIDFDYYHKDIINYNGIVFRSNYLEDSSDINPLFNIAEFNKLLKKNNKERKCKKKK